MTQYTRRLLLIGGFPKGYDTPFHPNTLSGKRLLALKQKHDLHMEFMDLWKTDQEEKDGIIYINTLAEIRSAIISGCKVIALGKHVYNSIKKADLMLGQDVEYLPHPASRRKIDLERLENGLIDKR